MVVSFVRDAGRGVQPRVRYPWSFPWGEYLFGRLAGLYPRSAGTPRFGSVRASRCYKVVASHRLADHAGHAQDGRNVPRETCVL